jgi:multiple sugar transport system permease protein
MKSTRQPLLLRIRRRKTAYLLVLPAVVVILAITIFPLIYSFRMTFFNYFLSSGKPPAFIGFNNWRDVFRDREFQGSLLITLKVVIPALLLEFLSGMVLAVLLNRKLVARGLIISLLAIPIMIAPAAAGLAFRLLYDPTYGPINEILAHLVGKLVQIDWLASKTIALYSIVLVDIWQQTPFIMLVLLAGLSAIPVDVYEAATIDGASRAQIFGRITLPLLRSVITVALLIRTIDLLKFFDLVFILTMGGPASSTETASFYTYLEGIRFFRVGYAAALSYVLLILAILLASALLRAMRQQEQSR